MCVCNYYACIGNTILQLAEGIVADLWRDFWIRETGTGQQVAQLHDRYMMMMIMMIMMMMYVFVNTHTEKVPQILQKSRSHLQKGSTNSPKI
jgi:general stress protein 26